MVRIAPAAEDSFAAIFALSKFGIAMAAMIRMIATTISNSIREKPFCFFMLSPPREKICNPRRLLKLQAWGHSQAAPAYGPDLYNDVIIKYLWTSLPSLGWVRNGQRTPAQAKIDLFCHRLTDRKCP